MSRFWREYLCRIGIHWRQYIGTGHIKGMMPELHRLRCRYCGKEFFVETGKL